MDIARGPVSCVIDSIIYVFGGAPASVYASLDSADTYNTKTNEWSNLAAMPDDLYAPAVDVINGKIYVLGGWQNTGGDNWATVNSVFEYDPAINTWKVKNSLPTPIGSWTSCVLNDSICLVGGTGDLSPFGKDIRFYTPETEVWTSLPDMISDRQGGAVVEIIDNKIYVIGGTTKTGWYHPTGKNEVYDLVSETWSELSVMPVPVVSSIGVVHNDKIIVFGGDYQYYSGCSWGCSVGTNSIQEYDPASDSWRLMEPMPFKRAIMAGEKVENYVYVIGGYLNGRDLDQPLDEVWRFNLDSLQKGCDEVIIQDPSRNLVIGDTYALHADVQPSEFANKAIVWLSDNEAVATVSEEGIVSCMGAGAANITATLKYGSCSNSYMLTVHEPAWMLMNSLDPGGMTCIVDSMIYSFAGKMEGYIIGDAVNSYNTSTDEWSELTPMPMPMTEGGIGRVGDKIYLVGGWKNKNLDDWVTTDSILEYDFSLDSWAIKTKCPLKIGSSAYCVMDSIIYLFGGWGNLDTGVSYPYDAMSYDPEYELWNTNSLPDMQYPHLMHGTAEVLDGNIYLLGGVDPDYTPQRSEKFDGEKWESIAEMPVPVTMHHSIIHNKKILVFGGDSLWSFGQGFSTKFIQEYDPASDSWRMMEPMPFQRSGMYGGKVGNYVYLMGGAIDDRDLSTYLSEVWRFNLDSLKEWELNCNEVLLSPDSLALERDDTLTLSASFLPVYANDRSIFWSSSDDQVATVSADGVVKAISEGEATITATANVGGCTASCLVSVFPQTKLAWEQMEDMPQATSWFGSCIDSLNEKVYVFGGQDATEALDLLPTTQIYDFKTDEWTMGADMPNNASSFSAEMVDGEIYILGEYLKPKALSPVKKYDPLNDTWTAEEQVPEIFYAHGSCVYDGLIYSFGGRDVNFNLISTVQTHDPLSNTWNKLLDMPYKRDKSAVCVYKDEIYLFGGNPSLKYSPAEEKWTELNSGNYDIIAYSVPIISNDTILLFGGYKSGDSYPTPCNEIWAYYPLEDTLVRLDIDMPFDRFTRGHKYENYAYLFGGHFSNSMGSVTNEVWRFDLATPMKPKIMVTGVSLDQHDLYLSLNDNPNATLIATITPANASDQSVSWSSSDQGVATVDQEGNVTGIAEGEATIIVTTTDGGFTEECSVEIITVGINKNRADRIVLFPNPTNKLLSIQTTDPGIHSLEITSLNGRLIFNGEMEGTTHQVDLSSFQNGVYFITIRSKDYVTTRKIIKL